MLKKIALGLCILTVSAGVMFNVTAKDKPSLVSDMQAYLVKTNAQGKEYRQPAKQTEPGHILEYNLSYTNQMEKSLSGLVVSGPIPANTTYIGRSAKAGVAADLLVSIDGGANFESEPVRRQKRMANGKMETVVIPAEQYTNIRWKVKQPIQGFGKQLYSYRVKVK
ncbi:MAG: hypothetical protein ACPG47_00645 [Leucothrix sp.]